MDTKLLRTVNGRYGRLAFFATDIGAAGRSLELYGEWAENELGFVRQFIEPGSVVLDVGAYVGTHTLAFAHFVGNDGCVVAFEPLPEIFDVLRENVLANHLSNVRLENVAVADRAGSIEIPAVDIAKAASFGSTSLRGQPVYAHACSKQRAAVLTKAAEVPTVAIDGLGLTKCSVIKIDAEGMESEVIQGAADTIRLLAPVVYAECNSVADGLKSLRQLKELGYEVRLHVVDAFAPDNFSGVKENIFGRAREAAMVGIPSHQIDHLDGLAIRPCELLVRVDTADDLVLGLLNKPQYTEEILRPSTAARYGAAAWLDEVTCLRITRERLEIEVTGAKRAIVEEQARTEQAMQSLAEVKLTLENKTASFEAAMRQVKLALENKTASFEAAMRQAQFARDVADAAERHNAQIDAKLSELRGQIESIHGSVCWRLTWPIRWFHRQVARLGAFSKYVLSRARKW